MNFINSKELLDLCHQNNYAISEVMMHREMQLFNCTKEEMIARMAYAYDIMKHAVECALKENLTSVEGSVGGESKSVFINATKRSVCGEVMSKSISYALGVLEVNYSMGLIVAAPTAGSSGVIPGVFLGMQEQFELSDEAMIYALFNAGAIGYLITHHMVMAASEDGCQAEVSMASAMAASAVCELMGGTPEMSLNAAAMALTNTLGLVNNPIMGLGEAVCQKRNAMGVSNALISAEMALCGLEHSASLDETIEVMHRISIV